LVKKRFDVLPFFMLAMLFVFNSLIYNYVGRYYPTYQKVFELDSTLYFAKFDHKYLLSKSCEILYQQTMIGLLAVWLFTNGFSLWVLIFVFALIFAFGHVPLLFFIKKQVGLFFLAASILSSFVFPLLILYVNWGIVYSYIFHWLFYIIASFSLVRRGRVITQ
jgi:hypothetical protein